MFKSTFIFEIEIYFQNRVCKSILVGQFCIFARAITWMKKIKQQLFPTIFVKDTLTKRYFSFLKPYHFIHNS